MLLVLKDVVVNTEEILSVKPRYEARPVSQESPNKFGWTNAFDVDPLYKDRGKMMESKMVGASIRLKSGDTLDTEVNFDEVCKMIEDLQSNS